MADYDKSCPWKAYSIRTVPSTCPLSKQKEHLLRKVTPTLCTPLIYYILTYGENIALHPTKVIHFFLTIVDDNTRLTWVFLLHNKTEVPYIFRQFIIDNINQYNLKPKTIKSDNSTEFTSAEFRSIINKHGIHHQFTCLYIPQQNGRVECKHQHIIQVARALKVQASIPDEYWEECVLTAVYLINRTPTLTLDNETPFFRFFKTQPWLHHLQVFGCRAFTKINSKTPKLGPQSIAGVFLGYSYHSKGYKILYPSTKQILVSRDVTFNEEEFPFSTKTTEDKLEFVMPFNFSDDLDLDPTLEVPPPTVDTNTIIIERPVTQINPQASRNFWSTNINQTFRVTW